MMTDRHANGAGQTDPPDEYLEAAVQRLLTENPDVAEQGITVTLRERTLILRGEVESVQRREEILRLVMSRFPNVPIRADIGLIRTQPPADVEDLP